MKKQNGQFFPVDSGRIAAALPKYSLAAQVIGLDKKRRELYG
jgi:hypothetical protein